MGTNRDAAIAAQGLGETDLAANRAGRVSEKQIARQLAVRRGGGFGVWAIAICGVVGMGGVGVWRYLQDGDAGFLVFMSIAGLVLAAVPLGIYYGFRFADPAKVATCTVTRIAGAKVGGFLIGRARGVYAIGLDGKRYSGFATELTRAQLGERVDAYVVAEHRIVVALDPVD